MSLSCRRVLASFETTCDSLDTKGSFLVRFFENFVVSISQKCKHAAINMFVIAGLVKLLIFFKCRMPGSLFSYNFFSIAHAGLLSTSNACQWFANDYVTNEQYCHVVFRRRISLDWLQSDDVSILYCRLFRWSDRPLHRSAVERATNPQVNLHSIRWPHLFFSSWIFCREMLRLRDPNPD